jgi:TRAP-type C4-dicarboxylate transport system substrate-binding protein
MDLWNSLPSDLQTIIEGAAGSAGIESWIVERRQNLEYEQKMIDYGLEVITIPSSDLESITKATVKVWDELAAMDSVSAPIIKLLKETCAFVGKPME